MFEFEKQIMKEEGRYPFVGYSYKVTPITPEAKLAFAKHKNAPHRIIQESEKKSFIEQNLNVNQEPFIGTIKLYVDTPESTVESVVRNNVLRILANSGVPGIQYSDPFGISKRMVMSPLQCDKDFTIEVGDKITYDEPKKLTWDDVKVLEG